MAVGPPPPPTQPPALKSVVRDGAFYDALGEEMLEMAKRLKSIAGEMKNAGEIIDDK
jgi:hypothetical protein